MAEFVVGSRLTTALVGRLSHRLAASLRFSPPRISMEWVLPMSPRLARVGIPVAAPIRGWSIQIIIAEFVVIRSFVVGLAWTTEFVVMSGLIVRATKIEIFRLPSRRLLLVRIQPEILGMAIHRTFRSMARAMSRFLWMAWFVIGDRWQMQLVVQLPSQVRL